MFCFALMNFVTIAYYQECYKLIGIFYEAHKDAEALLKMNIQK